MTGLCENKIMERKENMKQKEPKKKSHAPGIPANAM